MTYEQTLDWLFDKLPMYQSIGEKAYKKDLNNILKLMEELDNPHLKFKSIHVAGTNGKGSTSHMLASVLFEQGYKTGLYTSPHLIDFRERVKINGVDIPKDYIIEFVNRNRSFFEENQLSFFEMTVGLSFQYFADEHVDIAVVETGLGGRLDSTNIIHPLVSVITNIGLDHTAFLGDTLEKIAKEKAGIIKDNTPIIIGEYHKETFPIFTNVANHKKANLYKAFELDSSQYRTDLLGSYQEKNIKSVVKALRVLNVDGFSIEDSSIVEGLKNVVKNTNLLGRYQLIEDNPKVICDTAHNAEAIALVMDQLLNESFENIHIVFGMVKEKDIFKVLSLLPKEAKYYFAKPSIKRGMDEEIIKDMANEFDLKGKVYKDVISAYKEAKENAVKNDIIYIGGSTFIVADFLSSVKMNS